jgi:hypothetical protein
MRRKGKEEGDTFLLFGGDNKKQLMNEAPDGSP